MFFKKKYTLISCILLIFIFSCSEKETGYHSIVLTGEEYIQIGPHDSLQTLSDGNWCFEIFFTADTMEFPENKTIFSIVDTSQKTVFSVSTLRDSISYWYSMSDSDTIVKNKEVNPVWNNGFHFMAVNFNARNRRVDIWLDQIKIGTWNTYINPIPRPLEHIIFRVGAASSEQTDNFAGLIDECRIWDKTITDDQIIFHGKNPDKLTLHYNHEVSDIGLMSVWRFNHDTGLVVPDEGRGNIDAVIVASSGQIYRSSYKAMPQ